MLQSLTKKDAISGNPGSALSASPHLTSYFGGNYKKYEGRLGESSYIIKLSKPEYPELAPVEFVCNKIAYDCGLAVPTPFTLLDFGNGELAFVSRNFMEKRLSNATLNHLYHYLPAGETHYNVEEIGNAIFRETQSVQDVEMFFRMLLFDALVGNHDRHGRNLALIETSKGKRLAPIYDNPSYLGLESGALLKAHHAPYGKIWTRNSQKPSMADYVHELFRLDALHVTQAFFKATKLPKLLERISESPSVSPEMQAALRRLISERHKELEAYVGA